MSMRSFRLNCEGEGVVALLLLVVDASLSFSEFRRVLRCIFFFFDRSNLKIKGAGPEGGNKVGVSVCKGVLVMRN